jgi:hypothetical protein
MANEAGPVPRPTRLDDGQLRDAETALAAIQDLVIVGHWHFKLDAADSGLVRRRTAVAAGLEYMN